jgi:voltage-gated potassium channel
VRVRVRAVKNLVERESLFCVDAIGCAVLMLLVKGKPSTNLISVGSILAFYAFSRINEIAYAFYLDPLSQSKESDLMVNDRIRMAMRSYFGLAFNFAVLYYFLPISGLFKVGEQDHLGSFADSFYFSGVTLSTLGYGDVLPVHWVSRLLALCEVFIGILIIAVAIATYVGHMKDKDA